MNAAFFDVDETLVACKSMFTFLEYYLRDAEMRQGGDADGAPITHADVRASFEQQAAQGASRAELNIAYYALFRGQEQAAVRAAAVRMFAERRPPFIEAVVDCLRQHRAKGDAILLVSGAMADILQPLADHLLVDALLCSDPEVAAGRYTGRLRQQAIGPGKAALIRGWCEAHDIDPHRCTAYGDHPSDQPMLDAVGVGVAVYPDDAMRALAVERHWQRIE